MRKRDPAAQQKLDEALPGLYQKVVLAVTLKALANSSPGQRPGVSISDSLW